MQESQIKILGFDYLKELYGINDYFKKLSHRVRIHSIGTKFHGKSSCCRVGYCSRKIIYAFPIAQCQKTWSKKRIMGVLLDMLVSRKHLGRCITSIFGLR